jgi:hypothetical protein
LSAKVTGHNLGNITYLVSRAAELGGYKWNFVAKFDVDGSLVWIEVPSINGTDFDDVPRVPLRIAAGNWVFLRPGDSGLTWGDRHPVQSGLFEEIPNA